MIGKDEEETDFEHSLFSNNSSFGTFENEMYQSLNC